MFFKRFLYSWLMLTFLLFNISSVYPQFSSLTFFTLSFVLSFVCSSIWDFATRLYIQGFSTGILFSHFGEKMWMTTWLALFFSTFYGSILFLIIPKISRETLLEYLHYGILHPSYFLGWASFLFACNTALIYIVRIIIKFFYIKKQMKY